MLTNYLFVYRTIFRFMLVFVNKKPFLAVHILCHLSILWVNFCLIFRLHHLLQKSRSPHLQQQIPPQAKNLTEHQCHWRNRPKIICKNNSPPTFLPAPSAPCCSSTPLGRPATFLLGQEHFHSECKQIFARPATFPLHQEHFHSACNIFTQPRKWKIRGGTFS